MSHLMDKHDSPDWRIDERTKYMTGHITWVKYIDCKVVIEFQTRSVQTSDSKTMVGIVDRVFLVDLAYMSQ